jgi:hypothetical protein
MTLTSPPIGDIAKMCRFFEEGKFLKRAVFVRESPTSLMIEKCLGLSFERNRLVSTVT